MTPEKKFDYEQFRQQAVEQLLKGPINLAFIKSLLVPIVQDLLEGALQAKDQRTVLTGEGANQSAFTNSEMDLDILIGSLDSNTTEVRSMPKDPAIEQAATYDPWVNQFIIEGFYQGMTYERLQDQLSWKGWPMSLTSLMKITNQELPRVEAWHKRPLLPIYTFLWVTSIPFQLWQDSQLASRSAYVVAGIDLQGRRDIIGYYVGENDMAKTWSTILTDLQNRGVEDILIVCGEEPTSLREAFRKIYPQTHVHGCVMFQMRTSLHPLIGKDRNAATKILRALYTTVDMAQATEIWQAFKTDWTERYPLLVENWERNWHLFTGPLQYPSLVAKRAQRFTLLDTLNQAILSHLKVNEPYANEQEFLKSTFIISQRIVKKNNGGVGNWGLLMEQLVSVFDNRIKKYVVA